MTKSPHTPTAVAGAQRQAAQPWLRRTRRPAFVLTPQLERTLEGHQGIVIAVALTPDGRRALSAGDDARVRVWNLESGQLERTLEGHQGSVRAVALTPDGRRA